MLTDEKRIEITWYGTASVRITAGNSSVLIDPFFPFPDSRIKIKKDGFGDCSHILVTHGHFDHITSISRIVRPHTTVFCTKAPYKSLCRKGVPIENMHIIRAGTAFSVGDLRITAYKGNHIKLNILKGLFNKRVLKYRKGLFRKLLDIASCLEKKESLCYFIEAYGKRIIILGSLALAENVEYPTGADIALLPYQGSDDLYRIAVGICKRLRPKAVLLTHFDDTFPPFSSEIDTSGFEERMKKHIPVYKLRHGGSIRILLTKN